MTKLKDHHHDITSIKSLIQAFFDAINAADTHALASHFFPSANLTILRQDPPLPPSPTHYPAYASLAPIPTTPSPHSISTPEEKLSVVIRTSIENFIALIEEGKKRREGKPGPSLFEKPDLDATDVKIDGLFASAWSPFSVTFDGVLHHYGVMVYSLGKGEDGEEERRWRIEGLTQNYRRTPGWGESSGAVL
ncbi:hypothetical protein EJ04DRAFT_515246 [Polyplosphaeria fusca]|uniref:Uncharacterized protein n=1 Tax=Polyplosphaeria fusca TaxID=682080 RepID=A0A9P4QT52_9PLEO|nr:hypothetical protein EJ04DRAFT_515246 [Polyplosphaeria fusca]